MIKSSLNYHFSEPAYWSFFLFPTYVDSRNIYCDMNKFSIDTAEYARPSHNYQAEE